MYDKKKSNYDYGLRDTDIEFNSISAYDCTGLIPSAVTDEAQAEAYEELYPYLSSPNNDKTNRN